MKKIFLLLFVFTIISCEKDDICSETTPTTPRVIIEFYNATTPTVLKKVTNLGVIAPGFDTGIGFTNVSKIEIPLKTDTETTTLNFIANGSDDDTTNDNIDELTFNYTKQNVYVSRACGYKTVFQLTNTNDDLVTTVTDNWINRIEIIQPNIETENETHIKIYF